MSLTDSDCYLLSLTVSPSAKEFLYVSHCILWVTLSLIVSLCHACLSLSTIVACSLSLSPMVAGFLSLSFPLPRSCCMSLIFSYDFWLSQAVSSSPKALMAVSYSLLLLLIFFYCLSGLFELVHVSHCLLLLLAFSHCFSQYQGVAACLKLSPMVAGSPSLSLSVPWSCCMSLTVSHIC